MIDVQSARPEQTQPFWKHVERESLSTLYDFTVIWHERTYEFVALDDEVMIGAIRVRVAASLTHVDGLAVAIASRRRGVGRALLERIEDLSKYLNCHKITVAVPADVGHARVFFEACGYKLEAILPQHTFKLDIAVMRRFLL